jgi:hypothetical protein
MNRNVNRAKSCCAIQEYKKIFKNSEQHGSLGSTFGLQDWGSNFCLVITLNLALVGY